MDNKYNFQSLGFYDNVDLNGYKEAFEYAFHDNKIKNIALTGSYGAGKSSVIESYKKELKKIENNHRFLHISLAKFEQEEAGSFGEEEKEARNIEGKLLNQLVHQLSDEKLQKSPINVNANPDKHHLFKWIAGMCLFLFSIGYFGTFTWKRSFSLPFEFLNFVIDERKNATLFIIVSIVLVVEVIYGISYLTHKQMKYHIFRKICIKNNEIDLFPEESDFHFDKYMNEICTLFLDTESDVFVFEDLDRYKSPYIFEKLRELNAIINIKNTRSYDRRVKQKFRNKIRKIVLRQDIKEYCPIRFFYLVRDDIFTQTDRTKFFDFIIPVVPVISGHNSYTKIAEYLEDKIDEEEMSFIKQITLYVNDMRLVKNIVNEYQIYHEKWKDTVVDKTFQKMFAMIVFKNLFPKDYIELQTDHGIIVDIFSKKKEMVKEKIKEIEKQNEYLKISVEENKRLQEQTVIQEKKELNALLFPINKEYRVNGKKEAQFNNRIDFVEELLSNPDKVDYYDRSLYSGGQYTKETRILEQYNQMVETKEYQDKLHVIERIQNAKDKEQKELEFKIAQNENKIKEIKMISLKDYLNEYDFGDVWDKLDDSITHSLIWSDANNKELLKMLLTNGYIDESYGDFLSVFHEGNLVSSDQKYIRSVLDGDPLDIDYPIKNAKEVSTYLNENNLRTPYARNIHMFCFYFLNGTKAQKEAILDAVYNYKQLDLIEELMDLTYLYCNWIPNIVEYMPDFLLEFSEDYPDIVARMLLVGLLSNSREKILTYFDEDDISMLLESIDFVSVFQELVNHENDALVLEENEDDGSINVKLTGKEEGIESVVEALSELGYKVPEFRPDLVNAPDVSRIIYEYNLYEITIENLMRVLNVFYYKGANKADIHILYEQICDTSKNNMEPIYSYVNDNIQTFIMCKTYGGARWDENSTSMTEIINDADNNQVSVIINNMRFSIEQVKEIYPIERVNMLIKAEKLVFSIENIFEYYNMWTDAQAYQDEKETGKTVENCLLLYLKQYPEIELENSQVYFNELYGRYKSEHEDKDISELFKLIACDSEMQETKYIWLLKNLNRVWKSSIPQNVPLERFPILFEKHIVKMSKQGLIEARKLSADLLHKYILSNIGEYVRIMEEDEQIDIKELVFLLGCEFSDVKVNQYLLDSALDDMDEVLDCGTMMTKKWAAEFLLKYPEKLSLEQRVKLFIQNITLFNKNDMIEIFKTQEWPVPVSVFEGKNPTIKKIPNVKELLIALQKQNMIGRFKEDDKNPEYLRVYSKRNVK